jgi:Asp-tRNA(Asn)/Glu-tRNA(Gln) amidotransferase A subunit family amidase
MLGESESSVVGNKLVIKSRVAETYSKLLSTGFLLNAVVKVIPDVPAPLSGKLFGMTMAVKDMVAIKGQVRGNGNPHDMQLGVAELHDSPLITSLREAAVAIVATTSMLEYAAGAQHPNLAEARSPLNPQLTAGGSSSGSAALIGAGICDLAIGTDTGGSIRIPSAYCGAIGFKPTSGRLPMNGITALSPTFDHAGFLSKRIETIEQAMSVATVDWREVLVPQSLRLGIPEDWIKDPRVDDRIAQQFSEVRDDLNSHGIKLNAVDVSPFEEFRKIFLPILLFEIWEIYGITATNDPQHFGPDTLRLITAAHQVTREEYQFALSRRQVLLETLNDAMAGVDALIMPTVPYFPPQKTPPIDSELGAYEGLFVEVFNVTGQPAISLPMRGLPMPFGIHIVGHRNQDEELLKISQFLTQWIHL